MRGRRVRRGYLWQGGAKISQYRAEQGGAKHPSNRLLLFLSAILILFFCPIFLFSIFTKAAAGELVLDRTATYSIAGPDDCIA